jgi:hypothetical protein
MQTGGGRPTSWHRGHQGFQLGYPGGQVFDLRLLPRDGALLLLDFVEEHGVNEVVTHRLGAPSLSKTTSRGPRPLVSWRTCLRG